MVIWYMVNGYLNNGYMVNGYMVIRNDALSLFRISFNADNRRYLSAVAESIDDSPQQI